MNRSVICSVLFVCALVAAIAASAPAAYVAGDPVTGTITPSSGSLVTGVKQSFTATFSDGDGHADIADCRVLLNTALQGANGIFLRLDRINNRLWLRSDNNAAWLGGFAPGSGNVIENGRCTIYCDRTTFSGNGNTLTLNISLMLKPLVAGRTLTEWLYAGDAAGHGDGWNEAGAIVVVSGAPTNTSVSPSSGLVPAGAQTFTTVQRDASGYTDLKCSYLLINNAVSGVGAVYAWYDAPTNKLWLRSDDNSAWVGGYAPGSANAIENSRAKLVCSGTSVTGSGQDLTINWRLEMKPTMQARKCGIWLYAVDLGGANTGFEKKGEVTFDRAPVNTSLEPSASDTLAAGSVRTLTATYTDPDGHADIRNTYLVLNTALSSFRGISLWYDAAANKLYLRNDVNTVWLGGAPPGSPGGMIENSYCRVDCAATAVERDRNNLRVNWSIEPKSPMQGKTLKAWMYVIDAAGAADGYDQMASYLVGAGGLNVSVTPINTSVTAGSPVTFTTRSGAPNGKAATSAYLLMNTSLNPGGAMYLFYDGPGNKLWLRNDAGSAWLGGHAPGSADSISNNLVTINCAASSAVMAGNELGVNWSLTPKPAAAPRTFNAWMYTLDTTGLKDGWELMGTVAVTGVGEMVFIAGGTFLMGNNGSEPYSYSSELPQHSVYLSEYWIGKHEVTRGEYRRFMEAGGYSNSAYWSSAGWSWKVSNGRTQPSYWGAEQTWATGQTFTQTDSHPVVGVSYYEAEAYCAWAGGHLPTEAQWEKAARWTGSYPNVYPWGNVWDAEKCNNWYDHNSAGGGYGRYQTAPVGSYPSGASPYGLQEMAGNVWEWVADWYVSYPGSTSPFDYTGSSRVLRGGSWYYTDNNSRCADRNYYYPHGWNYGTGFRLVRSGG